jgi:transcriptional regulator with XRE-family HTH domain
MKRNTALIPIQPRRTPSQIAQLLQRYSNSGLTQREFAQSIGVGYSTLTCWLQKQNRLPAAETKPWVAVDVVGPAPSASSVRYQLEWPSGLRVSVSTGFDAQELAQLLNLASACSR